MLNRTFLVLKFLDENNTFYREVLALPLAGLANRWLRTLQPPLAT